ncbi:MAG: hypothetical protein QOI36_6357 [Pseudonocardiales bacterium]|nr:hypothetical protein [Pseudonocardiales bacterium]
MTDTSLRDQFDHLVSDEPTMGVALEPVVAAGRRMRRRRRTTHVIGAFGTAALAATAIAVPLVAAQRHHAPTESLAVTPFAFAGASQPTSASGVDLTAEQQRIADAIRQASPDGWTFDLGSDRWDAALDVEATADDGVGPGRLMLSVATVPGNVQVHPCLDPEFKSGVSCTERTLADGSVLSMRGIVDWHGIQTIEVVLTHPDGTGVMAESGNFVIDWPPPASGAVMSASAKQDLVHASRPDPTYTTEQLARVIVAVNRATD